MKFEVFDKKEEKGGLLFRKPVYTGTVRFELTDDEFQALKKMAKEKESKLLSLGNLLFFDNHERELRLEVFYSYCKKEQGVWQTGVRSNTIVGREAQIVSLEEIATQLKKYIDLRLHLEDEADQDRVVNL